MMLPAEEKVSVRPRIRELPKPPPDPPAARWALREVAIVATLAAIAVGVVGFFLLGLPLAAVGGKVVVVFGLAVVIFMLRR
ncbi:hypothetical protein [Falsiroseomonas oryzae]|uniref:hypothetical protein n=1 Tax=Falsiroseomonas oryzae TaxID=2766473 RepID=UPI0022EB2D64|nr:hypothetical protein [Roseomonas sp. MO-31]